MHYYASHPIWPVCICPRHWVVSHRRHLRDSQQQIVQIRHKVRTHSICRCQGATRGRGRRLSLLRKPIVFVTVRQAVDSCGTSRSFQRCFGDGQVYFVRVTGMNSADLPPSRMQCNSYGRSDRKGFRR